MHPGPREPEQDAHRARLAGVPGWSAAHCAAAIRSSSCRRPYPTGRSAGTWARKLATIRPSDDDRDKAFAETQTILKVYPSVKLMMAISAPAVPGSAEAVRQTGRSDVRVIGLSLPNINKPYVHSGVVQTVVLWNTRDLGYLTVYAGALAAEQKLTAGASALHAGRLGTIAIRGSEIVLGPPLLFNKGNIDRFDF